MKIPAIRPLRRLTKLNSRGFSHHIALVLVVLGVAIGGTYYLVATHADALADGYFNPLTPVRIVDTRPGSGIAYAGNTLGAGKTLNVQVAGVGGIPTTGVSAVVANITEASATAPTYVSVYPTGTSLPLVSTLDANVGQVTNNQTTVKLGSNGQISLFNLAGNTNLVVDVVGYYSTSGDTYAPVLPSTRIADTRVGSGKPYAGQTLAPGGSLNVQIAGLANPAIPADAAAVVVNATVVKPAVAGFLTIYPAGQARPLSSSLNYTAGEILAKETTAMLGSTGAITVYSSGGGDVILDAIGYYSTSPSGEVYVPVTPTRIADTRNGSGQQFAGQHLGPNSSLDIPRNSITGVPSTADEVVTNITESNNSVPQAYLTAYPYGTNTPPTSSLNYSGTVAFNENTSVIGSGLGLYNSNGTADIVVDLLGYFTPLPASSPTSEPASSP